MAMAMQQAATVEETRCNCGGALEAAVVATYRFEDELGRQTAVHHVPAVVCTRCGDVQIDPATVIRIERGLRRVELHERQPRHLDYAAD